MENMRIFAADPHRSNFSPPVSSFTHGWSIIVTISWFQLEENFFSDLAAGRGVFILDGEVVVNQEGSRGSTSLIYEKLENGERPSEGIAFRQGGPQLAQQA